MAALRSILFAPLPHGPHGFVCWIHADGYILLNVAMGISTGKAINRRMIVAFPGHPLSSLGSQLYGQQATASKETRKLLVRSPGAVDTSAVARVIFCHRTD